MIMTVVAVFHGHSVYRCLSLLCAQGGEPGGKKRESLSGKVGRIASGDERKREVDVGIVVIV